MYSNNICIKTNDTCKPDTYSDLFALDIRKNACYRTRNVCKTSMPPSCNIEKDYTLDYPIN
jgi:hypothetical protein